MTSTNSASVASSFSLRLCVTKAGPAGSKATERYIRSCKKYNEKWLIQVACTDLLCDAKVASHYLPPIRRSERPNWSQSNVYLYPYKCHFQLNYPLAALNSVPRHARCLPPTDSSREMPPTYYNPLRSHVHAGCVEAQNAIRDSAKHTDYRWSRVWEFSKASQVRNRTLWDWVDLRAVLRVCRCRIFVAKFYFIEHFLACTHFL